MLSTMSLNSTSHPFSSSGSSPRPSSLGIGRAPKTRSRFHTSKPYARSASVQRAKLRSVKRGAINDVEIRHLQPTPKSKYNVLGESRGENGKRGIDVEMIEKMGKMGVDVDSSKKVRPRSIPPRPEGLRFQYIRTELPELGSLPVPNVLWNGDDIVSNDELARGSGTDTVLYSPLHGF
jgi:hypothetical protein